jgi:hypothetical protein
MNNNAARTIETTYFNGFQPMKKTHAVYVNTATVNAVMHMQSNDYGATSAEVTNSETGDLYAVVKWSLKGIAIVYRANVPAHPN